MKWAKVFAVVAFALGQLNSLAGARAATDISSGSDTSGGASQPSEQMISLQFPPDMDLKVLIQYVGDRLGINFIYDEQTVAQKITIVSPVNVSKSSLLGLLQSALKMKGLIIVDGDQPGWKKILPAHNLMGAAPPTTNPAEAATPPSTAVTQVFVLRYADASKAETVIKPFLTQPGGNSFSLTDQHALVVSDFASAVQRIGELIRLMDQPPQEITTGFVAIKNVDVTALPPQLQQILAARDKAQTGTGTGAA